MGMSDHFIQWRNDQAKWCSEFMTYIREEFGFQLLQCMCSLGFASLLFNFKTHMYPVEGNTTDEIQQTGDQQRIDYISNSSSPKRRGNIYCQCFFLTPHPVTT